MQPNPVPDGSQVSRALKISSAVGRLALAGVPTPESSEPEVSPLQQQFLDAVKRIYGQSRVAAPQQPPDATNVDAKISKQVILGNLW